MAKDKHGHEYWSDKEVVIAFTRMLRTILLIVPFVLITLYFAVNRNLVFFDDPEIPMWHHILFFALIIILLPLLRWFILKRIWKA